MFDIFRELHVNLSLLDILQIMSKYAKYLKDVMMTKRSLGDIETIAVMNDWTSVVLSNILEKLKDIGSFTLPIQIGESNFV